MKQWLITVCCAGLVFAAACGDDGGEGDGSAGSGGTAGAGGSGGSTAEAGAGGQVSCDPPTPPLGEALAIAGDYEDMFGTYTISSSQWQNPPLTFNISAYSNDDHWVVARNDEGNDFDPCKWSRFDWVETTDGLYYCSTVFDADTEQEALDAEAPDSSDPTTGGCGGASFPWTLLTPP